MLNLPITFNTGSAKNTHAGYKIYTLFAMECGDKSNFSLKYIEHLNLNTEIFTKDIFYNQIS